MRRGDCYVVELSTRAYSLLQLGAQVIVAIKAGLRVAASGYSRLSLNSWVGRRVIVLVNPDVFTVSVAALVVADVERIVSQFVTNMPTTTRISVSIVYILLFPTIFILTVCDTHELAGVAVYCKWPCKK